MGATRPSGQGILLVEDDTAIAAFIAECLWDEGYAVTVAASLDAGLHALGTRQFALVLADALVAMVPGTDRWAAVERLRDAAGAAMVVVCTAHSAHHFSGYAERGFAALLTKPFDLDDLLALIARQLRHNAVKEGPDRPPSAAR